MSSSGEDPRSKRGGHALFDHSIYPDKEMIRVRGRNFTISSSFLSLHSPFFHNFFYGRNATTRSGRFELDVDPDTFSDLLDLIYPCYKKTNCYGKCSSSLVDRLDMALRLKLRFAVKRILKDTPDSSHEEVMIILQENNAHLSYPVPFERRADFSAIKHDNSDSLHPIPVSIKFPDSVHVIVGGMTMHVSATTLALHSSVLGELLYEKGHLEKETNIDLKRLNIHPYSFFCFLQMTTGFISLDCTAKFLDDLVTLGAKNFYDYYVSEIRKKIFVSHGEVAKYAVPLLEHYSNQPPLDIDNMKMVACYLGRDELEKVLSKWSSSQYDLKEMLRNDVSAANKITVGIKIWTGGSSDKTFRLLLPKGVNSTVLDLKMMCKELEGIPEDQQRFIFAGKQMEERKAIAYYQVQDKSTLHMVPRLRGC